MLRKKMRNNTGGKERAGKEGKSHFCSVTPVPPVKNIPPNYKIWIRERRRRSLQAQSALPPPPGTKTLVKRRVWPGRRIDPPCSPAGCREAKERPGARGLHGPAGRPRCSLPQAARQGMLLLLPQHAPLNHALCAASLD